MSKARDLLSALVVAERHARSVSPCALAADGGMPLAETERLSQALGLPAAAPDEPYFTADEANALRELARLRERWPVELVLALARVYGRALAEVAHAEAALIRAEVERRLSADGAEDAAVTVSHDLTHLRPLIDPMLAGVHSRWLEHELAQQVVRGAERSGALSAATTVTVSLLFCDLRDFAAFTEHYGDRAAAAAAARLSDAARAAVGTEGRLVKELGDGVMLAFDDPLTAVAAWRRLQAATRGATPSVHGGLVHGTVVHSDHDYFGHAVNLAARLADRAGDGELLVPRTVVEATRGQLRWRPRGRRALYGFPGPVAVFALAS